MCPEDEKSEAKSYADALKDATRRCERLVQTLSMLREMDALDDPNSGLKSICCRIVETIASGLAAENCSLFLADEEHQVLELRAACSPFESCGKFFEPGTWPAGRFRFGEGVAGAVAQTGAVIRVEDTSRDSQFKPPSQGSVQVRSLLCFPLRVENKLVGVLNLSHSEPGFFSAESENALSFVVDRAARMLANHLLHEQLRDSEEHYRLVAENADDAILVFGKSGEVITANPPVWVISGIPPDQYVSGEVSWESRLHPEDRDLFRSHQEQVLSGQPLRTVQYRCLDSEGGVRFLEQRSAPFLDSSGQVQGVVSVARDVTERKLAEERLLQAQKMECVGRLAGGVAHDFNNLITVISAYAEMLRVHLSEAPQALARLRHVEEAAERASQLVKQLLAFSRKQALDPKVLDLNQAVADTARMLERVLGKDVQLATRFAEDPAWVFVDPVHLTQVVMNLALNARDAMPSGGTLALETGFVDADEEFVHGYPECKPGRYVVLTVNDTGCGMTKQTLAQMWEPFFTTKEDGKGTGLGLATVYGIVRQSGGFIRVQSELERGSTFNVYLAYVSKEAEPPATLKEVPAL